MAQTLTEIKAMLGAHGLHPKKRLGQNFLHDHNQMRRIVAAAGVGPGDAVLEVGPGTGALTEWLLEAGCEVVLAEADGDFEPILRERLLQWTGRWDLVIGDVLAGKHELSPAVVAALRARFGDRPYVMVANLPYQVASPLLIDLVLDEPGMRGAVVMVQKEVADRITAAPGSRDYGPLSVLVQAACVAERVGVLGPGCFWPAPTVDSAVVKLTRRAEPVTPDLRRLAAVTQQLFQRRRKQLGTIVGRGRALPEGIDAAQRPETLTVAQLAALAGWMRGEGEGGGDPGLA